MKIRSVQTGEVIDIPEDGAVPLIEAGIYQRVTELATDTVVEPLSTTDMPPLVKKGKSK